MKQITVFGSSRCKEGDSEYEFAESVGNLIGKYGHNVATGGYPVSYTHLTLPTNGEV